MDNDMLKIIGLFVVVGCIVYLASNWPNKNNSNVKPYNSIEGFTPGEAGAAASYSTSIKSTGTHLLDTLLISKYRSDYENVILNMDDYVHALMLDTLLNIDSTNKENVISGLTTINTLNASKDALNNIMKFVDKN